MTVIAASTAEVGVRLHIPAHNKLRVPEQIRRLSETYPEVEFRVREEQTSNAEIIVRICVDLGSAEDISAKRDRALNAVRFIDALLTTFTRYDACFDALPVEAASADCMETASY